MEFYTEAQVFIAPGAGPHRTGNWCEVNRKCTTPFSEAENNYAYGAATYMQMMWFIQSQKKKNPKLAPGTRVPEYQCKNRSAFRHSGCGHCLFHPCVRTESSAGQGLRKISNVVNHVIDVIVIDVGNVIPEKLKLLREERKKAITNFQEIWAQKEKRIKEMNLNVLLKSIRTAALEAVSKKNSESTGAAPPPGAEADSSTAPGPKTGVEPGFTSSHGTTEGGILLGTIAECFSHPIRARGEKNIRWYDQ